MPKIMSHATECSSVRKRYTTVSWEWLDADPAQWISTDAASWWGPRIVGYIRRNYVSGSRIKPILSDGTIGRMDQVQERHKRY